MEDNEKRLGKIMEEHESQTKVTAFLEINEDAEDFEMEIGDTGLQG